MKGLTITIVLFAALGATACRQPGPLDRPTPSVTIGVPTNDDGSGSVDLRITRDDVASGLTIPAPRAALWALIPAAYEAAGLPEPALDRGAWTARLQNHTATRRLGGDAMAYFLQCGNGPTGPHANSRRIRMTVQTALESLASGETRAHTRVDAIAISIEGAGAAPLQCASTGMLERRINRALRDGAAADTAKGG